MTGDADGQTGDVGYRVTVRQSNTDVSHDVKEL